MSFFPYPTRYRFYTLAKVGLGAAYLWYIFDFFQIHLAIWNQMRFVLPGPSDMTFSGIASLDARLRPMAVFVSGKAMVWLFLLASPVAAAAYLWGRHRWLQFAVGCWLTFSMVSLTALVGVFTSTADIWLNYVFLSYALAALISSNEGWEQDDPGLSRARWKNDPALSSTYAWFIVVIQFAVYFFAGVNKLMDGWTPWTSGVALQNLAYDSSMHEFVRGIPVPYWISLILCYVTLLQRLVVPFGFFFARGRLWSVLILVSMHIGYAILMYVNLFPLVGISSLLMIWPPAAAPLPKRAPSRRRVPVTTVPPATQPARLRTIAVSLFSVWLFVESTRLTMAGPAPWENKLMIVPAWRMFADGGVHAGGKWRLILVTPHGEVDATDTALQFLPHIWRDRFYMDNVFHDLLRQDIGPGSLANHLLAATGKAYSDHQLQLNADPTVLRSGFELYQVKPPVK